MKTRKEILEHLYDLAHEDKIAFEIGIRNLETMPEDRIIESKLAKTPLGIKEVILKPKDKIEEFREEIKAKELTMENLKKAIKEDAEHQS